MTYDRGTALHEAAHSVVAARFGWELGPATVVGGGTSLGCSVYRAPLLTCDRPDLMMPFVLWPEQARHRMEADAIIAISGDLAERLLEPAAGRYREDVGSQARGLAARMPMSEDERQWALAAVDDPEAEPDAERVAKMMRVAHGPDLVSGAAWVRFCETQARAILLRYADEVRRVAGVLAAEGMLSAAAVTALAGAG